MAPKNKNPYGDISTQAAQALMLEANKKIPEQYLQGDFSDQLFKDSKSPSPLQEQNDSLYENSLILRPEILLLTKFNPLYNDDNSITEHGILLNEFINNLKLQESISNEIIKQTLGPENIKQKNDDFKEKINDLLNALLNLQTFLQKIKKYKTQTLFSKNFLFKPINFIEKISEYNALVNKEQLISLYGQSSGSDSNINLASALLATKRFNANEINSFSDSKLLLVSLQELALSLLSLPYKSCNFYSVPSNENSDPQSLLYKLPNFDKDKSFRITYNNLTDNDNIDIAISTDFKTGPNGYKRFLNLYQNLSNLFYSENNSDLQANFIKNVFLISLKEAHRIGVVDAFDFLYQNEKPSSYEERKSNIYEFIGLYESSALLTKLIEKSTFSGEKLSDLVFFQNANDSTKKVLLLENADGLNLQENVITGKNYIFSDDFTKTLLASTDVKFNVSNLQDLRKKLNNFIEISFQKFFEFGGMSLVQSPISLLDDLKARFLKTIDTGSNKGKTVLNLTPKTASRYGRTVQEIKAATTTNNKEAMNQGAVDTIGENFLVSIFVGNGLTQDARFRIINAFYSYFYSLATEQYNNEDETYLNAIADEIADVLYNDRGPCWEKDVSSNKKVHYNVLPADQMNSYFKSLLKPGGLKFVDDMVEIFKKYINLGKMLPAFFLALHLYISQITNYSILSISPNDVSNEGPAHYAYIFQIDLNLEEPDLRPRLNLIKNSISSDLSTITNLSFAILNSLQVLKGNFDSYYNTLISSEKGIKNGFINKLLPYVEGDKKALLNLFDEGQLILLVSTLYDLYDSYNGFSTEGADKENLFVKAEDKFCYSSEIVSLLNNFFLTNDEYRTKKGYNKQIISVGLPTGLPEDLIQKLKSFDVSHIKNSKQYDIFCVSIYKMDLLNPYLIYKPKTFLFEATRFPARIYSEYKKIGENSYDLIPTRNFDLFVDGDFPIKDVSPPLDKDVNKTFGSKYDGVFSSNKQKEEILRNHIVSFLLENYLKLISGLNVNELTFNLEKTSNQSSPSPYVQVGQDISQNQNILLNQNAVTNISELVINFPALKNVLDHSIIDPDPYIKKLIQPKKYDRVFNIIFDPEFEVDIAETNENIKNNKSLKDLVYNRLDDNKLFIKNSENGDLRYFDVDKTSDDVSMNSYFVTIETFSQQGKGKINQIIPNMQDIISFDALETIIPNVNLLPPVPDDAPGPSEKQNIIINSDFIKFVKSIKNWTNGSKRIKI